MMKIEIAEHQRMSETGSSLLRAIQNNEMPLLDLLVRESVQNSLDAALEGEGFVQVDFSIREFSRLRLAEQLEGISERLNELYNKETYRMLEIRDTNTFGLTGPIEEKNLKIREFGNLIKLVYHIGLPQEKEGSGGSWGLGKTVYFRIGIGLVIYYSRIRENGIYSSRLAACLVEDEEQETALLRNKGNHRGIAWWGRLSDDGKGTVPVTDEEEIQQFLNVLGIKPFSGTETGTVIAIPFLRDDLRPEHAFAEEDSVSASEVIPWWSYDDSEYIKVALQRWYAPRLMNQQYKHGRWLKATVNGEELNPDKFLPVFQVVQNLYIAAFAAENKEVAIDGYSAPICVTPINLRGSLADGSVAGWTAYVRLNSHDLKMNLPHNNYSPWVQVFGREIEGESNPALMCYTRKPGMIVGYENVGKWTDGISKTSKNEFIIGLFVANSSNRLKDEFKKRNTDSFTLEEYIRGCEKADHASWQDWTPNKKNPLIIEKIQRQVVRIIENQYKTAEENLMPQKNALLGKILAEAILPPEGFGRMGRIQSVNSEKKQERSKPRGRHPILSQISYPVFENGLTRIDFQLFTGKISDTVDLKTGIATESNLIYAEAWEDEETGPGTSFPLDIKKVILRSADKNNYSEIEWDSTSGTIKKGFKSIQSLHAPNSNNATGLRIAGRKNMLYKGSMWVKSNDSLIRFSIHVESVQEATAR